MGETDFSHLELQLNNWPLLDRSWLKSEGKRDLIMEEI